MAKHEALDVDMVRFHRDIQEALSACHRAAERAAATTAHLKELAGLREANDSFRRAAAGLQVTRETIARIQRRLDRGE